MPSLPWSLESCFADGISGDLDLARVPKAQVRTYPKPKSWAEQKLIGVMTLRIRGPEQSNPSPSSLTRWAEGYGGPSAVFTCGERQSNGR